MNGKQSIENLQLKTEFFMTALDGTLVAAVLNLAFVLALVRSLWIIIISAAFLLFCIILRYIVHFHINENTLKRVMISYCIMTTVFFIPLLYLTGGGIDSGYPLFIIFGFFITFLLLDHLALYISVVFEIACISFFFYLTYVRTDIPDSFIKLNDMSYISISLSVVAIGLIIGFILQRLMTKLEKERSTADKLVSKLNDSSNRDALSSAYNRRFLHSYLDECIRRCDKGDINTFSIIMFDIDHFKNVNDTYGHLAGDDVIRNISSTIKSCLRSVDVVSRYGGEEFVCVLPTADDTPTFRRAEQIRLKIESTQLSKDIDKPITISGGVANYVPGMTFEELIKEADNNLYIAKNSGRNQIVWHNGGIPPLCYNAYDEQTATVFDPYSKRRQSDL